VLFGSVQRRGGDCTTRFATLTIASGSQFVSRLTNLIRIGPLPDAAVDELLAASRGTLAAVLITG
jgi:hypothetical protein